MTTGPKPHFAARRSSKRWALGIILHALCVSQKWRCAYCSEPFNRNLLPTFEHVRPKSAGGGYTLRNGLATCQPCNQKKADRLPEAIDLTLLRKYAPEAKKAFEVLMRDRDAYPPPFEFPIKRPSQAKVRRPRMTPYEKAIRQDARNEHLIQPSGWDKWVRVLDA